MNARPGRPRKAQPLSLAERKRRYQARLKRAHQVVQVWLPKPLHAQVKAEAAVRKRSLSAYIAEALEKKLQIEKSPLG